MIWYSLRHKIFHSWDGNLPFGWGNSHGIRETSSPECQNQASSSLLQSNCPPLRLSLVILSEPGFIATYQVENSFWNYFQSKYEDILKDKLATLLRFNERHKSLTLRWAQHIGGQAILRRACLDEQRPRDTQMTGVYSRIWNKAGLCGTSSIMI